MYCRSGEREGVWLCDEWNSTVHSALFQPAVVAFFNYQCELGSFCSSFFVDMDPNVLKCMAPGYCQDCSSVCLSVCPSVCLWLSIWLSGCVCFSSCASVILLAPCLVDRSFKSRLSACLCLSVCLTLPLPPPLPPPTLSPLHLLLLLPASFLNRWPIAIDRVLKSSF